MPHKQKHNFFSLASPRPNTTLDTVKASILEEWKLKTIQIEISKTVERVSAMQTTPWGHKMPKFHQLHSNFQCLSSMSTALSKMASPTTVHVCTKVMHAGDQDGEEC